MSEKDHIFIRYIRLISIVSRYGHITFDEINNEWKRMFNSTLPRRSFVRHREAIADIFGIEIVCRKSDNTYYIKSDGLNRDDDEVVRFANMLSANRLISDSSRLAARVIHEAVPSGDCHLVPIIEAMKTGMAIDISYRKFGDTESAMRTVEPYCVKCFRRRWYLLGRRCDSGELRVYGLDRIQSVRSANMRFSMPEDFDPAKFFADMVGVTCFDIPGKQRILVRTTTGQRNYFLSLPTHSSQKEIEPCVFEFNLCPGYDFIQEMRLHADKIEILEPDWLRERMIEDANKVLETYKKPN